MGSVASRPVPRLAVVRVSASAAWCARVACRLCGTRGALYAAPGAFDRRCAQAAGGTLSPWLPVLEAGYWNPGGLVGELGAGCLPCRPGPAPAGSTGPGTDCPTAVCRYLDRDGRVAGCRRPVLGPGDERVLRAVAVAHSGGVGARVLGCGNSDLRGVRSGRGRGHGGAGRPALACRRARSTGRPPAYVVVDRDDVGLWRHGSF